MTDRDGGVVPGAQVVAVNIGTRDTYEATTNADGYYNIQFVRTGTYEITVTVSGFQTFKATGVEVANNQVVRTNAVLQLGTLAESITVTASATVLATDSARGFRNHQRARRRRLAAERPQCVEPGEHDAGRSRRPTTATSV